MRHLRIGNQQGSIGVFFEMVIVVVFIFVILFGVKSFNDSAKKADVYYPKDGSATSTKNSSQPSGISITGKDAPQVTGVSVGSDNGGQNSFSINQSVDSVVNYTDSGFVPNSVVVNSGTRKITFVNKSKSMMWPLSNGNLSPALDSGYGINPGGAYSYTFSAAEPAGTYGFYNRLNMMHKGSLILK